jgi:D-alanyl-D-alanine carboxypeptidase
MARLLVTVGGISSTAADIARFYRALLEGRLLRPDEQREMLTVVATDEDPLAGRAGGSIMAGFGIFRFDLPCGVAWGHGVDMPTYSNQVLAAADGSTIVVVAQNTSGWPSASATAAEMFCN